MRTRDLLKLKNTGHPGINALFAKAHSADWDFEKDVDWSVPVEPRRPARRARLGRVREDADLPGAPRAGEGARDPARRRPHAQHPAGRRERRAERVRALVLVLREEDYRNHAAAQAMDEARHHLAYRRFLDLMGEEVEDIDFGTEMMFDALLTEDDPLELIATEQFFLESFAMSIFEALRQDATHPLLRRIIELITRDESRHMGFGVLYIAEWMRRQPLDRRIAFARRWLGQILGSLLRSPRADLPGPRHSPAAARPASPTRRRSRPACCASSRRSTPPSSPRRCRARRSRTS